MLIKPVDKIILHFIHFNFQASTLVWLQWVVLMWKTLTPLWWHAVGNVYILIGREKPGTIKEKRGRNQKTKDAWVASTSTDHDYDGK